MKTFEDLSGPWAGWSIQDGLRITERITLQIGQGRISGEGSDMDGEFELIGTFDARRQRVSLTRRYHRTNAPGGEGVGIAYDYFGTWDGALVSGRWNPRLHPMYGGPFEMWPLDGEEVGLEELMQEEVGAR